MHPLERFQQLAQDSELWQRIPLVYRSLIVALARRDMTRAAATLDALAELWARAKEDTRAG